MNILVRRKYGWFVCSILIIVLLSGCGSGVSTDVLRPLWTKQVNQEVTPLMKDVFAPVSSQVSSELVFTSDSSWDVSEEKLPNYKYGLQHAKETKKAEADPLLVIHVKLDQPFESYPLNQLQEQIWSAKEQLKINGVQVGTIKLEYGGKTYFNGSLQAMNSPSDIDQFYQIQSKG